MLRSVYINNIALIKSQTLEFCGGFNVLSGETGAGKSIIVDSLMLILGGKFDKVLMRYGENICRVEAEFDTTDRVREYLSEKDIDVDDVTVISRKMTADGKNENRVNGRAVTLSVIRDVGSMLLDICGQNEYQYLGVTANHIKVLDSFIRGTMQSVFEEYGNALYKIRGIDKQLEEIRDAEERNENIEFLKRKLREIEKADIREGELDDLENRRKIMQSAGKILSAAAAASEYIEGNNENALSDIEAAAKALCSIASLDEKYGELAQRLDSVIIELEDIADTLDQAQNDFNFDRSDIDAVEDRIYKIRELTKKYGGYDAIIKKQTELREKIDFLENADYLFDKLSKEKKELTDIAYGAAVRISDERKKYAQKLEKAVMRELDELGMSNCVFKVVFADLPDRKNCEKKFTAKGLDEVEFYLSPNAGQPLKPLTKIISGGEQSRFMLALKVISGKYDDIPSLVFDEIDTGISGTIGREVAKKMAIISTTRQVLCVTHLPQIAAMADKNYLITKSTDDNSTVTNVRELVGKEVVDEIARLSGGKDISSAAETSAAEMKQWSNDFKLSVKKN